jgi:hypothetical protein
MKIENKDIINYLISSYPTKDIEETPSPKEKEVSKENKEKMIEKYVQERYNSTNNNNKSFMKYALFIIILIAIIIFIFKN